MLIELAAFEEIFGPFRLFRFLSFRSVGGAVTAFAIGLVIAPFIISRLRKLKAAQVFRDHATVGKLADLHSGKVGTPTMGGLIIFFSTTISVLLWTRWNTFIMVALLVYAGLTLIGFLDDYLKITRKKSGGLSGRYKLLGQLVLTGLALAILLLSETTAPFIQQIWIPFHKDPILLALPVLPLFVFFFLVLAGSSNAINLTDGVDGLAIGCTITVALSYGLIAYASGHAIFASHLLLPFLPGSGELAVFCAILCAASLAFLWHNAHPAAVFMGDTGSLALGGVIGAIAFMLLQPFTLVIIGGVFVAEALSVILQVGSFKTRRKRIFRMAPIHHHFELLGWAETQVVIRFWILSLICSVAGLATLKLR
jgi:phospho-N-acetylmuramoyl-pentapeptide-transferase